MAYHTNKNNEEFKKKLADKSKCVSFRCPDGLFANDIDEYLLNMPILESAGL